MIESKSWVTAQLSKDYNYLAPDGSEIRLLLKRLDCWNAS